MEPILELATRITSHLWYLHRMYPAMESARALVTVAGWRKKAEEDSDPEASASYVQYLLDLADLEMEPPGGPKWYRVIAWARWRYQTRKWEPTPDEWRAARNRALNVIEARKHELKAELDGSPREDIALVPAKSMGTGAPKLPITREELFDNVVEWVTDAAGANRLDRRVLLAKAFIPAERGTPPVQRFFIEQDLSERAAELRRWFAPHWMSKEQVRQAKEDAQAWLAWDDAAHTDERFRLLLDPAQLLDLCHRLEAPIPFSMVQQAEIEEIARQRLMRLRGWTPDRVQKDVSEPLAEAGMGPGGGTVQKQAFASNLFGMALSGGGIRSATFALGVLQGMADRNILPYIDVLSTVSGGGYIGSWLITWIKRKGGVRSVEESLRGSATDTSFSGMPGHRALTRGAPVPDPYTLVTRNTDPAADHARPIRLLRQYARYLAPKAGLLSGDTWTIFSTWLRNTFLNLLILVALMGAALLVPRIGVFVLFHLQSAMPKWSGSLAALTGRGAAFTFFEGALLWLACVLIGAWNLRTFGRYRKRHGSNQRGWTDWEVVSRILSLTLAGAFADVALVWYWREMKEGPRTGPFAFAIVVAIGIGILSVLNNAWPQHRRSWVLTVWRRLGVPAVALAGSMGVGMLLIYWLYLILQGMATNTESGLWLAVTAGVALMLSAIGVVVMIFLGLMGHDLYDEQREWWGRLGAWLILAILGWLAICAICFYMPLWLAKISMGATVAGIGWATITGWGSKLAYSPNSGRDGEDGQQNWVNSAVMTMAPAVFVIGMLSAVSFGLFWLVGWAVGESAPRWPWLLDRSVAAELCCAGRPFTLSRAVAHYWALMYPGSLVPVGLIVGLAGICLLLAWRVDVNEFSMHNFYKNRLVRCYLGASRVRAHRAPNAFTGFDLEDDVRMCRFRHDDQPQARDVAMDCRPSYIGPFPIVNTALNVTQGGDLGLQERMAESFVFTPLWSGFDYARRQASVKKTLLSQYAFQRTELFGDPQDYGVRLGTAMAISGAAFNANAGFHTSPTLAFLLTVFGVRLGWWAGNPRRNKWTKHSPGLGIMYLTRELTANTTTDSDFVLLSDGGHFENMGLYELVRRRCRYIVVSDAEADPNFLLEGIGGAIRKCRVDFGVVIDLDLDALQPTGKPPLSRLHYSVGSILYPGETQAGVLVYLKSSVTGDEPVDVLEFRKAHAEFPHTPTTDQFFDESHFESYRALGHHVAHGIFNRNMETGTAGVADIGSRLEALFQNIEIDWRANQAALQQSADKSSGKDDAEHSD